MSLKQYAGSNLANVVTAKSTKSFATLGFDDTNIAAVFEMNDGDIKSWVPGRTINAITGITTGKGYYIESKVDIDISDDFEVDGGSDGGGGGSQTLQEVFDEGTTLLNNNAIEGGGFTLQMDDMVLRHTDGKAKIGQRFNYPWDRTPFDTWTDGTADTSITADGAKTTFAGGINTMGSSISLPDFIGVSEWTITQQVKIKAKSSTSYGFAIGFYPGNASALGAFFHFLLASDKGYIAFTTTNSLSDVNSLNNKNAPLFIWAVDDVINITIQRRNRELVATMVNTNSLKPMISQLVIPNADIAVGNPRIYFLGGTWEFSGSYNIEYDGISRPAIAAIGDSITSGAGSGVTQEIGNRWFDVATAGVKGGTEVMAAGFENTQDGIYRSIDVVSYVKPFILLICYGINDKGIINDIGVFETNYRQIIANVLAGDTPPDRIILCRTIANTVNDMTAYNAIIDDIAADNSLEVVDWFALTKDPANTHLNAVYTGDYDTLHLNIIGNALIGGATRTKLLSGGGVVLESYQRFDDLPISQRPIYYLALDADGKEVKVYDGMTNKLIKNRKSANTMTDAQIADIFITGSITNRGDFISIGAGNLANPALKLTEADGFFVSTQSNLGNALQVIGGQVRIIQNWMIFVNGSYIRSAGVLVIAISSTGAVTEGLVVDNDTVAPVTGYKPFVIKVTDPAGPTTIIVAFIDKTGGAMFGGTTKNASAMVQIDSITKGFAMPRMSTTQRDAISSPLEGLEIYNLTTHKKNFYNGSAWEVVTSL